MPPTVVDGQAVREMRGRIARQNCAAALTVARQQKLAEHRHLRKFTSNFGFAAPACLKVGAEEHLDAVSYTHLTLPTICSV